MIIKLSRDYPARYGLPVISHVDTDIFTESCYPLCADGGKCDLTCCAYGVDVSLDEVSRIGGYASELENFCDIPRAEWFIEGYHDDAEFPGGMNTRTCANEGACVFYNREMRNCWIHSFCLHNGMDYHELKPMVSCLFPIVFDNGVLHPSSEVRAQTLSCLGTGKSLYQGARSDLQYYFGAEFIEELDEIEDEFLEN